MVAGVAAASAVAAAVVTASAVTAAVVTASADAAAAGAAVVAAGVGCWCWYRCCCCCCAVAGNVTVACRYGPCKSRLHVIKISKRINEKKKKNAPYASRVLHSHPNIQQHRRPHRVGDVYCRPWVFGGT